MFQIKRLLVLIVCLVPLVCWVSCDEETDDPTGSGSDTATVFDPNPAQDSVIHDDTVTLMWHCNLCNSVADTAWDLYVGPTGGTMELRGENLHFTNDTLSGLSFGTEYSWYVVRNGNSLSTGPTWNFTVERLPVRVYEPTPDPQSTVGVDVDLVWRLDDPYDRPHTFDIKVATADGTTWDTTKTGLTDTTFNPGTLAFDEDYVWTVWAISNDDDTTQSPEWSFNTVTAGHPGIYTVLVVSSEPLDPTPMMAFDQLLARFDSVYDPSQAVIPLQAGGVDCNATAMWWSDLTDSYSWDNGSTPFIQMGANYAFTVTSSTAVPALDAVMDFPDCIPEITSPAWSATVSLSGFDVTWTTSCGGTAVLTIMSNQDSTGVRVETPNDGSYTFTAGDLAPLKGVAGNYNVAVGLENRKTITAQGYDPRSEIIARGYRTVYVRIE